MGLFRFSAWPFVALLLALVFPATGLVHALVPHGDTHSIAQLQVECDAVYGHGHCDANHFAPSDSHDQTIWNFIHSLLAHEEEKSLPMSTGSFALDTALITLALLAARFLVRERSVSSAYEQQLARGIHKFRAFG